MTKVGWLIPLGLIVGSGCRPSGGSRTVTGLSAYVNRDLTKLNEAEELEFERKLQAIIKEKPDPEAWQIPTPRWIKPYRNGTTEWILLKLAKASSVPGSGTVEVYGFTSDWQLTFRSDFATGYRLSPTKYDLIQPDGFSYPVLKIHVESLGPFVVVDGVKRPAFHPESGLDLYLAFGKEGGFLIRLTTGDGKLTGNSFHGGFPSLGGPQVPIRTAKAWKADLDSMDTIRQLAAIMWLSSYHLNSMDWRKEGHARESVLSSHSFEDLRADPAVAKRLRELRKSSNPWVREQSVLALKKLDQPLAPLEESPG
ncbi:MAG: HEAT repeat domain-containing protein [Fimbriimonadaceae bacterium]|nr:HEAT repeat domain-containing protein [Fimbriimonadaceae bacterium]